MPPQSLQGAHSLHRETHHHLSLLDGSLSNPPRKQYLPPLSFHSAQSLHDEYDDDDDDDDDLFSGLDESPSRPRNNNNNHVVEAIIPVENNNTVKTATTVDDDDEAKPNDEQQESTNPSSWFDSLLDCLPCTTPTNKVAAGPVSPSTTTEEQGQRHCCECGSKLQEDYRMEVQVKTVRNEETGETSQVTARKYFSPSCFENRKLRNQHRESGYGFVMDEIHAFFEVKRQRTKELRRQLRAQEKGKAKARAQAFAKQVRNTRVEARANATFTRKRQEAERSSALLKMASLAQESARIVRQRQEAERQRQEAERSAVLSQYETDLANRLAKARAEAWAKSADFAASDKQQEQALSRRRLSNQSGKGSCSSQKGTTSTTSSKASRSSSSTTKIAKRAKKAVKKIACFSHANKADKGIWESTVDSVSGKTYYYNTKTLETTWMKPQEYSHAVVQKQKKRMSF